MESERLTMATMRRAELYTRAGVCLCVRDVAGYVTALVEHGRLYVLKADYGGVLRFHEIDQGLAMGSSSHPPFVYCRVKHCQQKVVTVSNGVGFTACPGCGRADTEQSTWWTVEEPRTATGALTTEDQQFLRALRIAGWT